MVGPNIHHIIMVSCSHGHKKLVITAQTIQLIVLQLVTRQILALQGLHYLITTCLHTLRSIYGKGLLNSSLNNGLTKKIDGSELTTTQFSGNTSLNSIQKSGFYRLQDHLSDTPSQVNYGQLLVIHGGGDTIAQLCFRYDRPAMYFRTGNVVNHTNGKWTPWVEVVHS